MSAHEGRKFAFTVGTALLVVAGLLWLRERVQLSQGFALAAGLLLAAGALAPTRLGPIHRVWMFVALAISKVTTPIFMGIVYLLVITPIGLVMRGLGRNPVRHHLVRGSYWVERAPGKRRSDLSRQF